MDLLYDSLDVGQVFDQGRTGLPYYDMILRDPSYAYEAKGVQGLVVFMEPDEYMRKVAELHGTSVGRQYDAIDQGSLEHLKSVVERGQKIDMLLLDYDKGEQEGRHRAMLATMLGLRTLPVLVVEPA